jgi:hypothetical protein
MTNNKEVHADKDRVKEVEVHVKSLKSGEKANFKISEDATLEVVWNEANVNHLKEGRSPEDTFRCADGTELTGRLHQTLAQLREEKVCVNRHFEIKGPSGGADA